MTTESVYNGQLITVSSEEKNYRPIGTFDASTTKLIRGDVVSGTIYAGVGAENGSPIINGSLGSWAPHTTSNATFFRTIDGQNLLRMVGSGTVEISW